MVPKPGGMPQRAVLGLRSAVTVHLRDILMEYRPPQGKAAVGKDYREAPGVGCGRGASWKQNPVSRCCSL